MDEMLLLIFIGLFGTIALAALFCGGTYFLGKCFAYLLVRDRNWFDQSQGIWAERLQEMRKLLEPCEHSKSRQKLLSTHSAQFNQLKYLWGVLAPHHAFARAKAEAAELELVQTSYTPGSVWRGLQTWHRGYAVRDAEVILINHIYNDMLSLNSDVLDQGNKTAQFWNTHLECVKSGRVLVERLEQKYLDGDTFDLVKYKLTAWHKAMDELARSCPIGFEQYIRVSAYDSRIIDLEDKLQSRVDEDAQPARETFDQLVKWDAEIDSVIEQLNQCDASIRQIRQDARGVKARSAAQDLEDVLDGQAKWLAQLRQRVSHPTPDDLLPMRKDAQRLREALAASATNVKAIAKVSDKLDKAIPQWIARVTGAITQAEQGLVFKLGEQAHQITFEVSIAELKKDRATLQAMHGKLHTGTPTDVAQLERQWGRASGQQGSSLKSEISRHLDTLADAKRQADHVQSLIERAFTSLQEYNSRERRRILDTGAGVARYAAVNFNVPKLGLRDDPDNPPRRIDIAAEAEAAVNPLRVFVARSEITQHELVAYARSIETHITAYTRILNRHERLANELGRLHRQEAVARNTVAIYRQALEILGDVVGTLRSMHVPVTVRALAPCAQQLDGFDRALAQVGMGTVAEKKKRIDDFAVQINGLLNQARTDYQGEMNGIRAEIHKLHNVFPELTPGIYTTLAFDPIPDGSWSSATLHERAILLKSAVDDIPERYQELHNIETEVQNGVRHFLATFRQHVIEEVVTEMGMDPENFERATKERFILVIVPACWSRGELKRLYSLMKHRREAQIA